MHALSAALGPVLAGDSPEAATASTALPADHGAVSPDRTFLRELSATPVAARRAFFNAPAPASPGENGSINLDGLRSLAIRTAGKPREGLLAQLVLEVHFAASSNTHERLRRDA